MERLRERDAPSQDSVDKDGSSEIQAMEEDTVLPGSLTASFPLKISRAPKGKDHLPTIIFQGLC